MSGDRQPTRANPFGKDYHAWGLPLSDAVRGLLLVYRGNSSDVIEDGHAVRLQKLGRKAAILHTTGGSYSIEGDNLDAIDHDYWNDRVRFLCEFDPDKGHTIPQGYAPVITRITPHAPLQPRQASKTA